MINITNPIVSVDWLYEHLNTKNLIILDATIQKVGVREDDTQRKQQISNAVFFDLKHVFLDKKGEYPNAIPSKNYFEEQVQKLGINNDSYIVVYDDVGVYSSPRVWWLFTLFGFYNVVVLNGGLKEWINKGYKTEIPIERKLVKGNFKANFNSEILAETKEVLASLTKEKALILDARSQERFKATVPEPRAGLRGGHIPSSLSMPYTELQENGKMKSIKKFQKLFKEKNPNNNEMIFSCGSGITACILALAAKVSGHENYKIYDGSWTEWASKLELLIEK